eukprot:CAMPEP_0201120280 /NCGR_PEP_ID=MMETSP0850-20130426/4355_1 /ASSEMBLY_ACC=CAM_ASM_000622 /TAXON_ID=183588 /ORGANISM="Pseudo-nitzschia fraudulenta, Strain WWA7" /LENGTH=457 /DNA_ID=CAMNT_0047386359 /DNA_START=62 /DNA_END=1438 /DNA_ORIENTATION=-
MPLESCMIIVDNSEFMRNGDYVPTRLEAQQDAANLLVGAKTQSHPESTVGVAAGTELLVSPTEDVGKLLSAVHDLHISRNGACFGLVPGKTKKNSADVTAAIQVASLALKHRKNKNGSQRIVLFIGSPLAGIEPKALAKAGRQLKKNNVSIDVVAMGELGENEEKLRDLVDAANGRSSEGEERSCHLVTIPPGVLPSDVLASSPIVHGGSGGSAFAASAAAAAAAGATGGDFGASSSGADNAFADFGGVDPNMDPELAMALRVSMEEERARQERMAAAARSNETKEEGADAEMSDAVSPEEAPSAGAAPGMDLGLSEEEALLQQALAMSMNENEPQKPPAEEGSGDSKPAASMETEEDDEAAAMQLALQMSLAEEAGSGEAKAAASSGDGKAAESGNDDDDDDKKKQFQDPQFVNQLLGSLPGVNPDDPAIQSALKQLNKNKTEEGDDKGKKDDDKK